MVRDKQFYRSLFAIALPAAAQSCISFTMGMADTIMVGQLGEGALAGVAVSNQVIAFLNSLLMGLTSGSAVLISQYWGKNDRTAIKKIFSLVFMVCCAVGLLALALARLWPRQILGLMTKDEAVIAAGIPYFTIVSFSFVLFAASTSLAGMLRNVEVAMAAMWTSLISSALNVFLNWVFIFGHLGVPAMGVVGGAWGTVISRSVELIFILTYAMVIQNKFPLRMRELVSTKLSMAVDYVKHGLPIAFGDTQWALVGTVKAALIGHLGLLMISSNAIADMIMSLSFVATSSLATGACVVVGKAVGAGDYKQARQYSNTIQILFAVTAAMMAALVFFLRIPITNLFNVSEEVRTLAVSMIAIGSFTLLGTGYHASCFVGIMRGSGDGRFVVKVDMVCGWLIVIPVLYLSAYVLKLPLPFIYLAARIDQCFKWIIAFFRLRGDKWIHNVTREVTPPAEAET